MMKYRTTEKMNNGKWENIHFEKLKIGDKFRLFEGDGTIVKDKDGLTKFTVSSSPIQCKPAGNFIVNCVEG